MTSVIETDMMEAGMVAEPGLVDSVDEGKSVGSASADTATTASSDLQEVGTESTFGASRPVTKIEEVDAPIEASGETEAERFDQQDRNPSLVALEARLNSDRQDDVEGEDEMSEIVNTNKRMGSTEDGKEQDIALEPKESTFVTPLETGLPSTAGSPSSSTAVYSQVVTQDAGGQGEGESQGGTEGQSSMGRSSSSSSPSQPTQEEAEDPRAAMTTEQGLHVQPDLVIISPTTEHEIQTSGMATTASSETTHEQEEPDKTTTSANASGGAAETVVDLATPPRDEDASMEATQTKDADGIEHLHQQDPIRPSHHLQTESRTTTTPSEENSPPAEWKPGEAPTSSRPKPSSSSHDDLSSSHSPLPSSSDIAQAFSAATASSHSTQGPTEPNSSSTSPCGHALNSSSSTAAPSTSAHDPNSSSTLSSTVNPTSSSSYGTTPSDTPTHTAASTRTAPPQLPDIVLEPLHKSEASTTPTDTSTHDRATSSEKASPRSAVLPVREVSGIEEDKKAVSSTSAPELRSGSSPVLSAPKIYPMATSGSTGSRIMNVSEEGELEKMRAERASRGARRGAFYAPPPPAFRPKVGAAHTDIVQDPPVCHHGTVLPLTLNPVAKSKDTINVCRRAQIGFAETIGKRPTMEDAWMQYSHGKDASALDLFGVFDGHRGDSAAKFAAEHLPNHVVQNMRISKNPSEWLRLGFIQTNLAMKQAGITTGTTAVVAMYWRNVCYFANAGDSRCVHGRVSGNSTTATRMTQDHKPERIDETERIVALGGEVQTSVNKEGKVVGRVSGQLGVSRALGDFDLEPYIIPDPEITHLDLLRILPPIADDPAEDAAPSAAVASSSGSHSAAVAGASTPSSVQPSSGSNSRTPIRSVSGHSLTAGIYPSSSSSGNASSSLQASGSSHPSTATLTTSSAPAASALASSSSSPDATAIDSTSSHSATTSSLPGSPKDMKRRPASTSSSSKRPKPDTADAPATDFGGNFDFLVIACDGLWDVVSDEEAISIAAHFLQSTRQPEEAAKRLRNIAYGRGSTDNITVLVAVLQSPSMGIKKSSSCIIL